MSSEEEKGQNLMEIFVFAVLWWIELERND